MSARSRTARTRAGKGRGGSPSVGLAAPGRLQMVFAVLALLLLAGCEARLNVDVTAHSGGGGEVRASLVLDKEAAAQVPDLAQDLRLSDLEKAGWKVDGPSPRDGGEVEIEAVKSFAAPDGVGRAVEELSGPRGAFRNFRLDMDRSFLETRTSLDGTIDLSSGLEGFSDEVLRQRLGSPLGVDVATLERQLGKPLAEVFRVTVAARLPGEAPTVVTPRLGQRVQLTAAARRLNVDRIVSSSLAVVAGTALLVVLLLRLVRSR